MGEKLSLVAGHVDPDRALCLAGFAGKTQVERLPDCLTSPAVSDVVAAQHLEEQSCPAAGAVLLLVGGHVARTHDASLMATALAHTHTAKGGIAKLLASFRKEK